MSIFTLDSTDGDARAGTLHTAHGDVPTPAFMPVATQGSVKAVDSADLRAMGATIVLANTYHLYLRPGIDVVAGLGGLHGFMGWSGPILTDSGGFQGFSLEHLRQLTEDAIVFKSHLDGSLHTFTPEAAIRYQEGLGADIIMPLDVCVPSSAHDSAVREAVEKTGRWAVRSMAAHSRSDQSLFGIVAGWAAERAASAISGGNGLPGVSGVLHRRPQCGRVQGRDVRGDGLHHAAAACGRAPDTLWAWGLRRTWWSRWPGG